VGVNSQGCPASIPIFLCLYCLWRWRQHGKIRYAQSPSRLFLDVLGNGCNLHTSSNCDAVRDFPPRLSQRDARLVETVVLSRHHRSQHPLDEMAHERRSAQVDRSHSLDRERRNRRKIRTSHHVCRFGNPCTAAWPSLEQTRARDHCWLWHVCDRHALDDNKIFGLWSRLQNGVVVDFSNILLCGVDYMDLVVSTASIVGSGSLIMKIDAKSDPPISGAALLLDSACPVPHRNRNRCFKALGYQKCVLNYVLQ
jgi:hypothetical protein